MTDHQQMSSRAANTQQPCRILCSYELVYGSLCPCLLDGPPETRPAMPDPLEEYEKRAESAAASADPWYDDDKASDPWYKLGGDFLKLPARASRDGDEPGSVVGTAVHVELFCSEASPEPPFLSVAFDPATGEILDVSAVRESTGFDAYESVLWAVIGAYMERAGGDAAEFKPSNITTTDPGLADYMFGLLQGSGADVLCVDIATQRVQWPSPRLERVVPGGAIGEHAPLVREVTDAVLASLVASGRARKLLGDGAAAEGGPPLKLVLLGACHDDQCGKLAPRRGLKRCSACKVTTYCSEACQLRHWKAGHRTKCKDIQSINKPLETLSLESAKAIYPADQQQQAAGGPLTAEGQSAQALDVESAAAGAEPGPAG